MQKLILPMGTSQDLILTFLYFTLLMLMSCSLEPNEGRGIRAHTLLKNGIGHAGPLQNSERYCQSCHGENLAGGSNGEPSCFQCHGRNWNDSDPVVSLAPSDHTELKGLGFRHHPDHRNQTSTCQGCHGLNLEGDSQTGTASCYLCHEQKWNG